MLPTAASGRISRGKATFLTSPALPTTEPHAPARPVENRFHTSKPDSRKIGNPGTAVPRISWNAT